MLSDDAVNVFLALISKLLDIAKQLSSDSGRNNSNRDANAKNSRPIKIGKLNKRDFDKLAKAGTEFKYVTVPKEKLNEIKRTVKKLGGSMFATNVDEGNNAIIAVPASSMDAINTALLHAAAQTMSTDPKALDVKNGEKLSAEEMKITADVMRKYDIPVYTFEDKNGQYINTVPKEFEGQYAAALNEARSLKKELDNIEITRYEQTSPLDGLDVYATKVSPEVALAMSFAAKQKDIDIQFTKLDGETIAVYPADKAEELEKAQQQAIEDIAASEKFLIDIKDNTITMDMEKLVLREDESSYFCKIPNTAGQDFIHIDKADAEIINDGKTLSVKLDMDKSYTICDESGEVKTERSGAELAQSYNTKSMYADKDTEIAKYGDGIERVELYNKEQNKLISLGMDSADKMRTELLEQGLSLQAAEKLLKDINDKLPEKYKETFAYSAEKSEIVYADIPNIGEYLAQSQLSQTVIGKAECIGELPRDNGPKCCIFDKNANQYTVLPVLPRLEVQAALTQMGYSEMSAKEIADKVVGSYRDTDIEKLDAAKQEKAVSAKSFYAKNPELADMTYCLHDNSIMIIKEENDQYKYMDVDKDTPRQDIEKTLSEHFGIADAITIAAAVQQLEKEGILEKNAPKEINEAAVTKVTTDMVEVSNKNDGRAVMMSIAKPDISAMMAIGISEKTAKAIEASVIKSKGESVKGIGDSLQSLKNFASETYKKIEKAADHIKEKSVSKGKER